ncbi:hypothetical protein ACIQM4_34420 [Streptomyces sp. NPDC091272]|uniref:hypothetical protein n=1 Tax=Streptomyces sp. NPDC091272 TaxID=3365981 RepID=UPI003829D723
MTARRSLTPPPPDMSGLADDFGRMRKMREAPAPAPDVSPPPAPPSPEEVQAPEMTRRSWYVTRESADTLRAAVDEVHRRTRGIPKHVIASALFTAAAANADAVARALLAEITADIGE